MRTIHLIRLTKAKIFENEPRKQTSISNVSYLFFVLFDDQIMSNLTCCLKPL